MPHLRAEKGKIDGLVLLKSARHLDARGVFCEIWNARACRRHGVDADFVQDNFSLSAPAGVIRGLHFQAEPNGQAKFLSVIRGAIWDVAVDLRHGSPTFGKHAAVRLAPEGWDAVFIPSGFAHGFCTLEPGSEILYKVDSFYAPESERGIRWNDPELGIEWPATADAALLSERDRSLPSFREVAAQLSAYRPCGVEAEHGLQSTPAGGFKR